MDQITILLVDWDAASDPHQRCHCVRHFPSLAVPGMVSLRSTAREADEVVLRLHVRSRSHRFHEGAVADFPLAPFSFQARRLADL